MPKDILKTTNFKYVSAGKGIADNLKALESSGIEWGYLRLVLRLLLQKYFYFILPMVSLMKIP